ncbi:MAG: methyltransferase [Coprobacter sp.]|nr:methyltransferase [Coprobacter sp.]
MGNDYFQFKQFTVYQNRCAMKVGTDGVLLGAWSAFPPNGRILDVGTGTGVIALMAAQRTQSQIDGVEIDADACRQAVENVALSSWSDRISLVEADFKRYAGECTCKYDYIVSNPPFFRNALLSPAAARSTARHTVTLDYDTLFACAAGLLSPNGKIGLIFPAELESHVFATALLHKFYLSRLTRLKGRPQRPVKRILAEWSRTLTPYTEQELCIEQSLGVYSEEYKALLQDFYLRW